MLVPLVLRSIVLPYLRSTTLATTSSTTTTSTHVVAIAGAVRVRSLSTSTKRALPAEAVAYQDQDDALKRTGWRTVKEDGGGTRDPQRYYPRRAPPPFFRPLPTNPGIPRSQPVATKKRTPKATSAPPDASPSRPTTKDIEDELDAMTASPQAQEEARSASKMKEKRDVFDLVPGPPPLDIPPAIDQLLGAKLYRMTVFHLISVPEYLANAQLVNHVVRVLEKNQAGKLARRLRKSVDRWMLLEPADREGIKVRLFGEERGSRESREPRPDTYWRQPVIPRDPSEYRGTPAQRRTHYINHRITAYLTVQHPTPYWAANLPDTVKPPSPGLRRVQDVLALIDRLRKLHKFVPDRVTVNIVVKAWVVSLSNQRDWKRLPAAARQRDLRDIFRIIVSSIEQGTPPILFNHPSGSGSGSGLGSDSDSVMPFDGAVEYERHVKPLTKHISKALVRAGDVEGKLAVRQWDAEMKVKLLKAEVEREIQARRQTEEEGSEAKIKEREELERKDKAEGEERERESKEKKARKYRAWKEHQARKREEWKEKQERKARERKKNAEENT